MVEEELGEGEVVPVEDVSRPLRGGEGGENKGGRGGDILEFGKVRCGVRGETFDCKYLILFCESLIVNCAIF